MPKKLSEMNHDEVGDFMDAMNLLVQSGLTPDAVFVLTVTTPDREKTYTTTSATNIDTKAAQRYLDSLEVV